MNEERIGPPINLDDVPLLHNTSHLNDQHSIENNQRQGLLQTIRSPFTYFFQESSNLPTNSTTDLPSLNTLSTRSETTQRRHSNDSLDTRNSDNHNTVLVMNVSSHSSPTNNEYEREANISNESTEEENSSRNINETTNNEEDEDSEWTNELLQLLFQLHNILPFIMLLFLYFSFQHTYGIIYFICGSGIILNIDTRFRAQVALMEKAKLCSLLGLILQCFGNLYALQLVSLSTPSLKFGLKKLDPSNAGQVWDVLWVILVNDFTIRFLSIICKVIVASIQTKLILQIIIWFRRYRYSTSISSSTSSPSSPREESSNRIPNLRQNGSLYRRKRKIYALIEMSSIFLRCFLATIPWCQYYQECDSKIAAKCFTIAYLCCKGIVLGIQVRQLRIHFQSIFSFKLEYGTYVSSEELIENGVSDCSICYDAMESPVKLQCGHFFCEDCVCEWFDRERSCPLCRADVMNSTTETNGTSSTNTSTNPTSTSSDNKPKYLDGSTSLFPQFF